MGNIKLEMFHLAKKLHYPPTPPGCRKSRPLGVCGVQVTGTYLLFSDVMVTNFLIGRGFL